MPDRQGEGRIWQSEDFFFICFSAFCTRPHNSPWNLGEIVTNISNPRSTPQADTAGRSPGGPDPSPFCRKLQWKLHKNRLLLGPGAPSQKCKWGGPPPLGINVRWWTPPLPKFLRPPLHCDFTALYSVSSSVYWTLDMTLLPQCLWLCCPFQNFLAQTDLPSDATVATPLHDWQPLICIDTDWYHL